MIKRTTHMEEVEDTQRFCDVCDEELHWSLACSVARCQYCGKELCEKCIGFEEDTGGDWRMVWCEKCWSIGEKYRLKIEKLSAVEDLLYTEWYDKCKEQPNETALLSESALEKDWMTPEEEEAWKDL